MKHYHLNKILYGCTILLFCSQVAIGQADKDRMAIENALESFIQIKGQSKKYTIQERMKYYHVPGISIAVIKNGQLNWAKGYGMANTLTKRKVDKNTLFQAGSISKPLAALAALKLVEEGKVKLDENVNKYLKNWKIKENKFTQNKKVTLRRLLTHSAGTTVHGFPGYKQSDKFPDIVAVLSGKGNTSTVTVDMEPGTKFRYSGGGYTIMEKVVEDVSGMPLEKYMAKYILQPMGLTNSTYAQPLPKKYHTQASAAYNRKGKIVKGLWHNYPEQAAAGLWTTPSDLAKYCIEIQQVLKGKKKGVLSKETVKKMLTKHQSNWGLGPQLRWGGDSLIFRHGGKNEGFTNDMLAFAHRGNGLIIMTNGDNGGQLMREIQLAISKYYGWGIRQGKTIKVVDLKAAQIKRLLGKYKYEGKINGKDYLAKVKMKHGKLLFEDLVTRETYTLEAMSDTHFVHPATGNRVIFKKEKGQTDYAFYWNGRFRFNKIK